MEGTAMENRQAIPSANEEALLREYYEILKIVGDFDGRLLTVKGWGVTLSLAALSLGFQQSHYGLFLVASLSGLGFWLIEGTGYPFDSGSPNRLWFGLFPFDGRVNNLSVSSWFDCDGLLR